MRISKKMDTMIKKFSDNWLLANQFGKGFYMFRDEFIEMCSDINKQLKGYYDIFQLPEFMELRSIVKGYIELKGYEIATINKSDQ